MWSYQSSILHLSYCTQLPVGANARAAVMTQVSWFLPATWETQIEFAAACFWLSPALQAFGKRAVGESFLLLTHLLSPIS